MAIRTISIFQGHYLALQGGGMWDELSGFSLLEVLTRSHRSDHSISDPTTVSPRQAHVPPSALIFPDRRMSGICLDGMTIFDEEEDDQHSSSLDGLLPPMEIDPPLRIEPSHDLHGLGISGLWSKDGSAPFTGLGLISVRPSPWRYTPTSANLQSNNGDRSTPSNPHDSSPRYEVYDTNVNVVQAQTQKLESFVEPDPGSSDAFHAKTETVPLQQSWKPFDRSHFCRRTSAPPRLVKHFAVPTTSSELKKISPNTQSNEHCRRRSSCSADVLHRVDPFCPMRPRARVGISLSVLRRSLDTCTEGRHISLTDATEFSTWSLRRQRYYFRLYWVSW